MDQSKRHIAVLTFPFASHSLSIFTLARMISKSAPDLNISYISTSRSIASVFKGSNADGKDNNIKPFTIRDGLPEGYKPSRNPTEPIALFLNVARDSFREGIQKAESERGVKISCLLSDAFVHFAADIAQDLKVPWVAFWGAAPTSIAIHYHTDNILEKLASNETGGKEVTTLDFIPGLSGITKDDLPTEVVTYGKSDDVMSSLLYDMGKQLKRAAAIVINSFEEMDQEITNYLKSTFSLYLNVGPFTLLTSSASASSVDDDTSGCLTWLSSQEPSSVAYVSFGSVIVPPPHEIVAIAEALEESKVPFLWSFRGDPSQLLPQGFSERTVNRGKITAWAPQVDVLSHASVGAFVTHGGWNSVVETITGGVPMICRPFFGDQKLNRKLMQDIWGIGTGVEGDGITKDGLVNALRKVLLEEEGKKMREKITRLKKLSVEACEAQGSSVKCFKQLVDLLI